MVALRILLVLALVAVEFVVVEGHRPANLVAAATTAPASAVIDR